MKLYYYIFALLIITEIGYSQTHIYEHFGVDEGLPSSEVYDIHQDKQGHIWFATDKGLSRYNGYEFENFTTKDGLPDNTILDFYPQDNGQIWFYGYNSQSLYYFNEVFDGFKAYKYNDALKKALQLGSIIKSIVVDDNETLYIGGFGLCGLIEITKNGTLSKQFDLDTNLGKDKKNQEFNLGVNTKSGVLFTICNNDYKSTEDVLFFNPKSRFGSRIDFVFLNNEQSVFIDQKLGMLSKNGEIKYYETKQNPIGIKQINKQSFFVGYYNNGAEIRDASAIIIKKFLPNKSVTNFLIDKEGSYWFSTLYDGVFYVKNPNIRVLTEESIFSLVKDNTNTLYAGYNNGDIAHITKTNIDILYRGLKNNVAIVEFDKKKNELYGYSDYILNNYTNPKKPLKTLIKKLPENIDQELLFSQTHSINKRENDSIIAYILDYKVQDVSKYKEDILVGTSSGLLIHKNGITKPHQPIHILTSRIDDIDVNKKTNTAYMATQGNGVVVYNDSIYNITKKDGLTNDIVSEIHIENDSTIWACSNTGLNKITFKPDNTFDVTTITKSDGLLSNDIDDIEIINDTVWVATKKGLCYFKKEVLAQKETSKILSLTLKDVFVNNKRVNNQSTKLKYNQNTIDIKLQAISHKNTNNINYLYRLKEADTTWVNTTNRNISFLSLSPGKYTFQAKASVLNNVSDNLVTYSFHILPPFWKSWWFYSLCVLFFTGVVYLFFKIRVLTYNKDIIRELIRLAIKRLKRKEQLYKFRSNGEDFKIPTHDILYINSQGNYLDIVTDKKTHTIRCKIGDFITTVPDALEYLRVHRSYIIRIDQVSSKGRNWVVIKDQKIPVGETYLGELEKIQF